MRHDKAEDRLYTDPDMAQFYDLENDWGNDRAYCLNLAKDARSVLDLGCGTGVFLLRLPIDKKSVGVDPAAAMLDVARQHAAADHVTWVAADARTVRLNQCFDLIVLTGHAFQVFLTDDDQRAVLSTISRHLEPGGRFIFDSRNPTVEEWRAWNSKESLRTFHHPRLGEITAWNDAVYDPGTGIVIYRTHYRSEVDDRCFSAESVIRFSSKDHLAGLISEAGLAVDTWIGDWRGNVYNTSSRDIIPIGRLA